MTKPGKGRTLEEVIERIRNKTLIEPITECWLFQGAKTNGYGQIKFCGRMWNVHRISAAYYLELDLNDSTQQANHICVNKNCSNPKHIYVGTQTDNTQDSSRWGLARGKYSDMTHCIRGHEFTEENTYTDKYGKRSCKICRSEAGKLYRESHGN